MRLFVTLLLTHLATYCQSITNDRPIIGILAQEQFGKEQKYGKSYIAASYVKYLEAAGARVVPIRINQTAKYYEEVFNSINGVLFPGGSANLATSGYRKAGKIIFDLAIKANDNGDYFPLWGSCLGFELLNYLVANGSWMKWCSVQDVALSLDTAQGYEKSRTFKNMPNVIKNILISEPVTINYHRWCLTEMNYTKSKLNKFYQILTTSTYRNITFISTIEAYTYPFYAVAWHPEKNQFEFVNDTRHHNIPHTSNAILVSQYFANFFVNETRKSNHRFRSRKAEQEALIYNYQPMYTGRDGSSFEQKYFFNEGNGKHSTKGTDYNRLIQNLRKEILQWT